jgi:hypothetical protein
MSRATRPQRLLVFNCHEAWVHGLRALDHELDLVVDLPGRPVRGWDHAMRPMPANARAITLGEAQARGHGWDAIVTHNVTDLLDARGLVGPKILVIHSTLEGRLREEGSDVPPAAMRALLARYVAAQGVHVVAVSKLKGRSWGFEGDVVPLAIDPDDYLPRAEIQRAEGLRVSNGILQRARILRWDLHRAAFDGLPIRLVGRNPDLPGVVPTRDWDDLKRLLAEHRFFVHTADPALEDGYNTATLEAMAAGLPILGNRNPTSPIEHGKSGLLADDPAALRRHAEELLGDPERAAKMGAEARRVASARFGLPAFRARFSRSIEKAKRAFAASRASVSGRS